MRSRRISRALRVAGAAGLVVLAALGALMLMPPILGYERYVIAGGSMGGAVPRGSIAYERRVPVERLRTGDVITYTHGGARVTHRIAWTGRDPEGRRLFQTRGDANQAPDPWRFTLPRPTQPVVRFHVPLAGYLLAALSERGVRIVAIGLPALAVAATVLLGAVRPPREATA
jgi:signal peptidase